MNTLTQTGTSIYAGDPDYDAFHGRVVGEYTVKRKDRRRNCIILTTYEVIDVGRGKDVKPADADDMIEEPEPWDEAIPKPSGRGRRKGSFTKDNPVQGLVVALLTKYGPSVSHSIAERTGVSYRALNAHILLRKNTVYYEVGHSGRAVIWGLVGVHDQQAT